MQNPRDWYIFQTIPGREELAANWMRNRANADVYYPMVEVQSERRRTDLGVPRLMAAWQGYIFTLFRPMPGRDEIDWEFVRRRCPFASGYVTGPGGHPIVRKDEHMLDLRRREIRGEFSELAGRKFTFRAFLVGSSQRCPSGALAGAWGRVTGQDDTDLKLDVTVMGKDYRLSFPLVEFVA